MRWLEKKLLHIVLFITPKTKEVLMRNNAHITNSVLKTHQAPVKASDLSPSIPLDVLQAYICAAIEQRGFNNESPQDLMLLMAEAVGELAREHL
jgi:hypothetical protein